MHLVVETEKKLDKLLQIEHIFSARPFGYFIWIAKERDIYTHIKRIKMMLKKFFNISLIVRG